MDLDTGRDYIIPQSFREAGFTLGNTIEVADRLRRTVHLLLVLLWMPVAAFGQQPPAHYLLAPGDVVRISVYNNPDMLTEAQIGTGGKITFPLLGEVEIAGLDKGEAESRIARLLAERKFVLNPQVNVLLTQYRGNQVSVLGQVSKPGKFALERTSNLTDVLAYAGGIGAAGADTVVVYVRDRDGALRKQEIDLNAMMMSGDLSRNLPMTNGDIVYVPRASMFYIYGEVQRPGVYRLERDMTVMQALSVGGGLTVRGTERGVRLHRHDSSGKVQTLEPRLTDRVLENDVVFVRESLF